MAGCTIDVNHNIDIPNIQIPNNEIALGDGWGPASVMLLDDDDRVTPADDWAMYLPNDLRIGGNATITASSGNVDIGGTLQTSGISTLYLPTGSDNSVLIKDSDGSIRTDEVNPRVWNTSEKWVKTTGVPANDQLAVFTDSTTVEGAANLTYDGLILGVKGTGAAIQNVDGDDRIAAYGFSSATDAGMNYASSELLWVMRGRSELAMGGDELKPYIDLGLSLGNVEKRWNNLFIDPSVGVDTTVLILNPLGEVQKAEVDSKIFGTNLISGAGSNTRVAFYTSQEVISSDNRFLYQGDGQLELHKDGAGVPLELFKYFTGSGGPGTNSYKARGTFASPLDVAYDDAIFAFNGKGYAGGGWRNAGAFRLRVDTGTISATSMPGKLVFYTTPNGSTTLAERMTIKESGNVGIATTTPAYELDIYGDLRVEDSLYTGNLSVGTVSPSASFRGDGDIYATSGIKAMEGLYSESKAYGAGLEISDNDLAVTYTNVIYGDATLTASTHTITDTHASFTDAYIGQFLRVISSTPSFTGATGEIVDVIDSTHLVLSLATAGGDTIVDATDATYVIYPHPNFFVGDNGTISANIGVNEDASFEVHIDDGNGFHGFYVDATAGVNQFQTATFDTNITGYTGVVGINSFLFATSTTNGVSASNITLEINEDNITNSHLGFIDIVGLGGNGNGNDLDVIHIEGLAPTDHILHAGTPDTLVTAYYDDGAGTTASTTTAFNDGTPVTIFENDNSIVYYGSDTEFTTIGYTLSTNGTRNIYAEYYYCDGDNSWKVLPSVTDTTNGERISGTISFPNPGDRGQCDEEIDSTAFPDTTDLYYIAVKRTRNAYPTQKPITSMMTISGGGDYLYMDSYGYKPVPSSGAPYTCDATTSGMQYYDSSDNNFYGCNASSWVQLNN